MPRGSSHFAESEYQRHAQEGARTMDQEAQESFRQQEMAHQQRMEAMAAEREARIQRIEEAHDRVKDAIAARKEAEATALANKRIIYEDRLSNAVVALHKIKRDDPEASDKRNALVEQYPELRMSPKGDPKLHPDLEEFDKWTHASAETAAKQKEKSDLLQKEQDAAQAERDKPPKGTVLKGFTSKTGNRFESVDPSPRKTAAEIEKLQSNFEKQHAAYAGSLGTEIGNDVSKNIARGVARNAMVSAGRQLQKSLADNPDEAARVKADMDGALLLEHNRFENNFADKDNGGRAYETANPGALSQFNQVKTALGYQPLKWDEASKKYVEVAPEPNPPAALPKNAVGGQESNSQFEKDAGSAGNSASNPPAAPETATPAANPSNAATPLPTPSVIPPPKPETTPPPVADVTAGPATIIPAATEDQGEKPGEDITPDAHAALKSGDKFWWKGKQLIKQ